MSHEPKAPPDDTDSDLRMAELLASQEEGKAGPVSQIRSRLQGEESEGARDLLGRLDALDFVNSVVGQVSDMPERLGDYRITGLLGRGGMGTVFEAFQESLERDVALKVLSPTMAQDPAMRQRFRSEARATAALHHQHIVPIYGFGEAGGCLYFAMERVNGISLDKHIAAARYRKTMPLPPREAARRFAGVADALGHAHKRRILHRDVKPGNLLVHPDGTLALADFGLSKVLGTQSMSMTAGGAFLGTLHYTPPEQALGRDLSPASDLYSLGVTIFETVTGQLPLEGRTTEAMLEALLHGRPRRLRELVPDAPKDLEAVVDKLLQREPHDRYADGEELARDLLRVADGEPVHIRRRSWVVRSWRWARKNRAQAIAIGVAILLLLVLLLVMRSSSLARAETARLNYENGLVLAMEEAASEAGAPAGPRGLFEALTGVVADESAWSSRTMQYLRDAIVLDANDPRAETLRAAYLLDPAPEATALLRQGRGYEAKKVLDQAIAAATTARREFAKELQRYSLYLARAVAALTESVGSRSESLRYLALASELRPGALFPRLLTALLEHDDDAEAETPLARLEAVLKGQGDEARRIAMHLARAYAGLHRAEGANLIQARLAHTARAELERRASQVLGPAPTATRFSGLEGRLALLTQQALAALADAKQLATTLAEGRRIVTEQCDPASSLQAFRILFVLLRERSSGGSVAELRGKDELQLRAFWLLLAFEAPQSLLKDLEEPWRALQLRVSQEALFTIELRALWETRLGGEQALVAANRWVQAETDRPEAYLCRFRADALAGKLESASSDAAIALQMAVDRERTKAMVIDTISEAERRAGPAQKARWTGLRQMFEKL